MAQKRMSKILVIMALILALALLQGSRQRI